MRSTGPWVGTCWHVNCINDVYNKSITRRKTNDNGIDSTTSHNSFGHSVNKRSNGKRIINNGTDITRSNTVDSKLMNEIISGILETLRSQKAMIRTSITIDGKRHKFEYKNKAWYVNGSRS